MIAQRHETLITEVCKTSADRKMGEIIEFDPAKNETRFQKAVPDGMHPADKAAEMKKNEKRVDALSSVDEIDKFVTFFLERGRYRDALICVLGCNTGLRISDILWLRWKDIFKDGETTHRRETICQKNGKYIEYLVNDAVIEAALLYKQNLGRPYNPDGWIFISEGPRTSHVFMWDRTRKVKVKRRVVEPQPMQTTSVSRLITEAAKKSGLFDGRRVSTHSFRATGLNAVTGGVAGVVLDEALLYQAKMVETARMMAGHSKSEITVNHYLTDRFRVAACIKMNLGLQAIEDFKKKGGIQCCL